MIVVWSEASVSPAGGFVQDEAGRARTRGVLLPVRIDDVEEPLGFGQIQSLDLVGWSGDVDDPRFGDLVAAARAMKTGARSPASRASRTGPRAAPDLLTWLMRLVPAYLA